MDDLIKFWCNGCSTIFVKQTHFNHEKHAGSSCRLWPSRKFARTRQICVVKNNSLKTMTYQVAQLLFICSQDTMCLDLFLLVHFIMIPKMFVSIITHWFNVLSLAQKWTHNPKKQFLLKYFWTSAFFIGVARHTIVTHCACGVCRLFYQ